MLWVYVYIYAGWRLNSVVKGTCSSSKVDLIPAATRLALGWYCQVFVIESERWGGSEGNSKWICCHVRFCLSQSYNVVVNNTEAISQILCKYISWMNLWWRKCQQDITNKRLILWPIACSLFPNLRNEFWEHLWIDFLCRHLQRHL